MNWRDRRDQAYQRAKGVQLTERQTQQIQRIVRASMDNKADAVCIPMLDTDANHALILLGARVPMSVGLESKSQNGLIFCVGLGPELERVLFQTEVAPQGYLVASVVTAQHEWESTFVSEKVYRAKKGVETVSELLRLFFLAMLESVSDDCSD